MKKKYNVINEYFEQFIDKLTEYYSVVNQFFLTMIKQKFDEPKDQLEKEINNQKSKLERIKKAYINGAFELKEYNEEKHIVEKTIVGLEEKADFIMRYVEDIELTLVGNKVILKQINFRDPICKPWQELYDKGYIDITKPMILENVLWNKNESGNN